MYMFTSTHFGERDDNIGNVNCKRAYVMSVLNNELQFNLGNMLDKIISVCINRQL